MHFPTRFRTFFLRGGFTLLFCAAQPGFAQNSSAGANSADAAWFNVSALSRAAASSKVSPAHLVAPNPAAAAAEKIEREQRAQKFRAVAQGAKAFYIQNPAHPRANEARKLEALAALEGITPTDRAYALAATATAAAFRTNPGNPAADRFEVAHALERRDVARKIPGRPWYSHPALGGWMLDRLHGEFGDLPEVWGGYLALAENTECDHGRDFAARIVQSTAPGPTKASARRLLDRYALVRTPINFPLSTVQGRASSLSQLAGKVTVVCLWDGSRFPNGPSGLQEYAKNPAPDTRWVYLSVGTLGALPKGAKSAVAPPGTTCVEPLGWSSPLITTLHVSQLPYVFVFDEKRQLSGYGHFDEIPALIKGIGRPILP